MPGGEIPLTFDTRLPWALEREPVTVGVPFPPSALAEADEACLFDGGRELYCQRQVLATWPDGSVRWLLLDFQVDLPAGAPKALLLVYGRGTSQAALDETGISLTEGRREITVDTGPLRFEWRTRPLRLFETVHLDGAEVLSAKEPVDFRLVDLSGAVYTPSHCELPSVATEAGGPLRAALRFQGSHLDEAGRASLDFDLLLTAWSGRPYVVLEHQIVHRGGEDGPLRRLGRISSRVQAGRWIFAETSASAGICTSEAVDTAGPSDRLEVSKKIEKSGGSAFSTVQLEVAGWLHSTRLGQHGSKARGSCGGGELSGWGLALGPDLLSPTSAKRGRVLECLVACAAARGGAGGNVLSRAVMSRSRGIALAGKSVTPTLKVGA